MRLREEGNDLDCVEGEYTGRQRGGKLRTATTVYVYVYVNVYGQAGAARALTCRRARAPVHVAGRFAAQVRDG